MLPFACMGHGKCIHRPILYGHTQNGLYLCEIKSPGIRAYLLSHPMQPTVGWCYRETREGGIQGAHPLRQGEEDGVLLVVFRSILY